MGSDHSETVKRGGLDSIEGDNGSLTGSVNYPVGGEGKVPWFLQDGDGCIGRSESVVEGKRGIRSE